MKRTLSFLNSPLSLRPWVSRLMLVAYMHALLQGILSPILASDQLQRPIPLYTLKIEKILEGVEKGGLTGSLSQSKGYLKTTSLQKFSGLQVCFEESTMLSNSSEEESESLSSSNTNLTTLSTSSDLIHSNSSEEESKSLSSSSTHLILRPGELSTYSHLQEVIKENKSLGFSWNVDGYHQVFVSWDGSVTLQGMATTERKACLLPALEISTFSSVLIKDTVADVLKIHALKTLIEGESHIQTLNVTGDNTKDSGVYVSKKEEHALQGNTARTTSLSIQNLHLQKGKFVNQGNITFLKKAHVHLDNKDVINEGMWKGEASFHDVNNIINHGDVKMTSLEMESKNFINRGNIDTDKLILNLQTQGSAYNYGAIKTKISYVSGGSLFENMGRFHVINQGNFSDTSVVQRGEFVATNTLNIHNTKFHNHATVKVPYLNFLGTSIYNNGHEKISNATTIISKQLNATENSRVTNYGDVTMKNLIGNMDSFTNHGKLSVADGNLNLNTLTNKGVVSGKAVNINAKEIVNETSGSLSIKELYMNTEKFTNKGNLHITNGMQTPHTTTIINTGTMKISDVTMPENHTFLNLENHGNFSLKGGKYAVESFINHENSTLTVEDGTEVYFYLNFENRGHVNNHSDSLFFDWTYEEGDFFTPELGNFTSDTPLSFNLLNDEEEQNSEFWLNLFTDPQFTLNVPITLWMDNLTLTKDMVIPFDLSMHLRGDFKMGKASLKAKSLNVVSGGNIFLNHNEKSHGRFAKIMTEGRLNFEAVNIYAGHAQLASYGKMNLKATEFLDVGAFAEKSFSVFCATYQRKENNGSYLFSHKKITLKSPKINLDYSWISTYSNLSVTSKNPISHIAANTQVGGNSFINTPEFSHSVGGVRWVGASGQWGWAYSGIQKQVLNSARSQLTVLGQLLFNGNGKSGSFINECSDLILNNFTLHKNIYKEISHTLHASGFHDRQGWGVHFLGHGGIHASTLQINKNLTIKDAPHVEFTGIQSIGGDLVITGDTFTGHNHDRLRSTVDTSTPLNIPMEKNLLTEVKTEEHRLLSLKKGQIVSFMPSDDNFKDSKSVPRVGNRPTGKIVNPTEHLHKKEIGFHFQRQIYGHTTLSLEDFIRNTKNFGPQTLTYKDLETLDTSIAYYTYETINEVTYRLLNIHIAPKDRNPYRSTGDTYVGGNLSIITKKHQEHRNNRMVSWGPLHLFSKGTMNLITEKYSEVTEGRRHHTITEKSSPEKILISLNSSILAMCRNDYFSRSISITGYDNVDTGSTHGNVTETVNILTTTTTEKSRKNTTTTNTNTITKGTIKSIHGINTVQGGDGKSINSTGMKREGGKRLVYNVPNGTLNLNGVVAKNTQSSTSTKSGVMGKTTQNSTHEYAIFSPELGIAPIIEINCLNSNLTGVQLYGDLIINNSNMTVKPLIVPTYSTNTTSTNGPLGSMRGTQNRMQEQGLDTTLSFNTIQNNGSLNLFAIKEKALWGGGGKPKIIGNLESQVHPILLNAWETSSTSTRGIFDKRVGTVIALATTIGVACLTSGAGLGTTSVMKVLLANGWSVMAAKMSAVVVSTALNRLCSEAFLSVARGGSPLEAAKHIASTRNLRGLACSAVSAGFFHMTGLDNVVSTGSPLSQHLFQEVPKTLIQTSVDTVVGGEKLKEALLQNIIASGARVGAGKIGALYGNGDVSSPIHKGLHLTLGGFVGALSNVQAPLQGAISGAFAGVMAEVIAEALTQTPAESLRETLLESNDNPHAFSQFLERFETHVERTTDLAHLITVGIASALNLDLATASRVANNAVKNNMAPALIMGAIALFSITKDLLENNKNEAIDFVVETTGLSREEAAEAVEKVLLVANVVETIVDKLPQGKLLKGVKILRNMPVKGILKNVPVKNTVKVVNKTGVFKLIPVKNAPIKVVKNTVPVKVKNRVTFFEKSQNPPVKNTVPVKTQKTLLEGEGKVGTYGELKKGETRFSDVASHHMPNNQYMKTKGVSRNTGISMNVEHPHPGTGGRHREIHRELIRQDPSINPRDTLAESVNRARKIYRQDGLYEEIRPNLLEVIQKNKEKFPNLFDKNLNK